MLARGRNSTGNIYATRYTLKPMEGLLEMEELLQKEPIKRMKELNKEEEVI